LNGYAEDIQLFSKLNDYTEDSQRHNLQSWMVMPKTVNGITFKVEWLCLWQSTA
jgi:hypothetical protein